MANLNNFNAANVDPAQVFEPIPGGDYLAAIIESEMKDTKAGTGSYLNLTLEVLDGQFKGRKVFDRLNLQNQNLKAVEIAQRTLSAICHATGIMQVQDSSQLHHKPMIIKVTIRPADAQYDATNEVKGYKSANAPVAANDPQHTPAQQTMLEQQQGQGQQQQAPAARPGAPWGS